MNEIKNAEITSAEIEIESHGILTVWLYLDYGGSGQVFGGYGLQANPWPKEIRNRAGIFIRRILETVGVEKWSELKRKTIRVNCNRERVFSIGHITKEHWFDPEQMFQELEGKIQTQAELPGLGRGRWKRSKNEKQQSGCV